MFFFPLHAQYSPSSKGQPLKAQPRHKREQAPYPLTPGANPAENGSSSDNADRGSQHYHKPTATDYAATAHETQQHRAGPGHALYT